MQFGLQNYFGFNANAPDPADTVGNAIINTGDGASDGEYLMVVPTGGRGLVLTMASYSVAVAEDTTAQVLTFVRQTTPGVVSSNRTISINAGDGTGATTMTIPITQSVGDCYRVHFGVDTTEDHVLNPGESLAVILTTAGTGATATGFMTIHGYTFDVGPQTPVTGTTHLTAVAKPNANGTGSIYNLIG